MVPAAKPFHLVASGMLASLRAFHLPLGLSVAASVPTEFMRRLQGSKYFYEVDLVETSQSDAGGPGNTGFGFKKFTIRTRVDYLGMGGKAQMAAGENPPAAPKTGA